MGATYDVVLADPPWHYSGPYMADFVKPVPYPTLTLDELVAMRPQTSPDAVCLLWTTGPKMADALALMEAWGFVFKTVLLVWHKLTSRGNTAPHPGFYNMASEEFLLLGTRGKVKQVVRPHIVRQWLAAERREHSRKPDEVFARLDEFLLPGLRRLEMFARERRPGWESFGNEIERFS